MTDDDLVTITLKWSTLEAAVNCTQALSEDRREPERYRDWYRNAAVELELLLRQAAAGGGETTSTEADDG